MDDTHNPPVHWYTPRDIDRHDGYRWHYHSRGSDLRIITFTQPGPGIPVARVVGYVLLTRHREGPNTQTSHDSTGTVLGRDETLAVALARVAQAHRASRLETALGHTAAERVFDGNTDTTAYPRCLRLDADGDPRWWDEFGPTTGALSDEWAEAMTPHSLMAALGVAQEDNPYGVWETVLCDRYEEAFRTAWHDKVIRTARHHCPVTRRGIFQLTRTDTPDRTETTSLVIIADDEQAARQLAAEHAADRASSEGADLWFSSRVTVDRIGDVDPDSPPRVVIAETLSCRTD
jgi:hypothetical protein